MSQRERGDRGGIFNDFDDDAGSSDSSSSSPLAGIFGSGGSSSSRSSSRGGSRGTRGGTVDDSSATIGPEETGGNEFAIGEEETAIETPSRSSSPGTSSAAPARARTESPPPADESESTDPIDAAAETFTRRISEPFGEVVADATPVTAVEQRTLGTSRSRDFFESAGTAVAELGNVPAFVSAGQSGFEAVSEMQDTASVGPFVATTGIPNPEGQDEVGANAADAAVETAAAAADNPFAAAGTATGAVLGGFGAAGGVQRARRSTGGAGGSTIDLDDFIVDTRAQSGGRRRGTQREQETITIERMADEQPTQRTGPAELEDIPGVTVERRGSQRQQQRQQQQQRSTDDLEADILDGLDDLGIDPQTGATTRTTARTQAGTATPPFATSAEASAAVGFGGAAAFGAVSPFAEPEGEQTAGLAPAETAQGAFAGVGLGTDAETTQDVFGDHDLGALDDTTTTTATDADTSPGQDTGTAQEVGATATVGVQQGLGVELQQDLDLVGETMQATSTTTGAATISTGVTSRTPPPRIDGDLDTDPFDDFEEFDPVFDDAVVEEPTRSFDVVDDDVASIGADDDIIGL